MASSNNIIISFSIAILLLLILLLLVSYNSKCKLDNSEKFDDGRLYTNGVDNNNFGPNNYDNVKFDGSFNNVAMGPDGKPRQSIADISNKSTNYDTISGGLGNIDASNNNANEYYNPVSVNLNSSVNNSLLNGTGASANSVSNDGSCFTRDRLTSSDLLPLNSANSEWAQVNPATSGDVKNGNFLTAGYHIGINTIGQSLRNANLQLRSEIPNPQIAVSPWMISTIEPDIRANTLEIGSSN